MKKPRDSQRGRVFKAEWAIPDEEQGRYLATVPQVQRYVDDVVLSRWWEGRSTIQQVDVKDGRGRRSAVAFKFRFAGVLRMPRWSRTELVICHELAHLLTSSNAPSHGREFCRNYLALLDRWCGNGLGRVLREQFRLHGVKWYLRR